MLISEMWIFRQTNAQKAPSHRWRNPKIMIVLRVVDYFEVRKSQDVTITVLFELHTEGEIAKRYTLLCVLNFKTKKNMCFFIALGAWTHHDGKVRV